jgi:hypothetical protein
MPANIRRTTFAMRPVDGRHYVYVTRAAGVEIPKEKQPVVFGPETAARAQVICDALNRGLMLKIMSVVQAARREPS